MRVEGYETWRPWTLEQLNNLTLTATLTILGANPSIFFQNYRTEICNFSGFKIYPGHGKTYIKADSRSYRLINGKCESLFLQRIKPSKLDWTIVFRRLHKKGQAEEASKKRSRRTVKAQRAVVGATLDAIKAKKAQKPELRASLRAAAAAKSKEAKKVAQEKKKAELSQVKAAQKGNISKQQSKGAGKKIQATSR
ncbi:hypothetical protein BCR33DRAFT_762043 [Rhizoclosmatium globosum]|uniref:Large ribosomal subunit protein eL24-related N-terminal domain-containing protein n=2 Tax=Rhizoclosmatium globosum TaxID=329046 RepID=A0A1Y2CYI9_9FUNG|nr:60S ribosomal protein L24 [Rhizoclosmatium sp. JEL0117]ORY52111.1 hypothetical protein BCR33DRAFT_762043 [Rhizoclosmatium globosum]|eukprot:ORY52111.1 hypothetical protein BCR33DRAFT_762043 [Rhizoclosmatium globosum]